MILILYIILTRLGNCTLQPTFGDFPIDSFGTDADLAGNKFPFALLRGPAAVPRDPGVEPLGHRSQRENFRAQPRVLQFLRKIICPDIAELGALREQLFEAGFRVNPSVGSAERNGVAMIGAGVEGRLGQNRSGASSLKDQNRSFALMSDQMDRASHHEMHVCDGIATVEQGLATLEVPLSSTHPP